MKKLNRKGYLTIEIILASVLAFAIAFFLIDLTMAFVDKTDSIQMDTLLLTDKALVVDNLKNLIEDDIGENNGIMYIFPSNDGSKYDIRFFRSGNDRILSVSSDGVVNYTKKSSGEVLYTKKLNESLSNFSIDPTLNGNAPRDYIMLTIKAEDIFSDNNYDMNILINNG